MTTIILTSRPWWYRKPRRTEVGYGRISEQGAQANIVSPTDTQLSWAITPIRDTGLLFRAAWVVKHWRISRILSAPTGSVAVELWRGNGSNNPLSVGDANAKIADIGTVAGEGGNSVGWGVVVDDDNLPAEIVPPGYDAYVGTNGAAFSNRYRDSDPLWIDATTAFGEGTNLIFFSLAVEAVLEPSSATLLLIELIWLRRRRRRALALKCGSRPMLFNLVQCGQSDARC